jgi:hypothetical protein
MYSLSKYVLAPALVGLLAGPALAQRTSPPTASQITPSRLEAPLYRTPDAGRAVDLDRDPVSPVDRMTNRLRTRSLYDLNRLNRLDEPARDIRRLESLSVPSAEWRLGLTWEDRLRLANLRSRYDHEQANIPATGRLFKSDTLGGWRDYLGQTHMQGNDLFATPPPGLRGPTPAPGGTSR